MEQDLADLAKSLNENHSLWIKTGFCLKLTDAGMYLFAASLLLLVLSLLFSFYEVNISTTAINIELEKFDEELKRRKH